MMHRFGHGHSLALGALLTLALEQHALLVVAVVFMFGFGLGRGLDRLRKLVESAATVARAHYPKPSSKRKARAW